MTLNSDVIDGKSIAEELIFDKGVKVIAGPCLADAVGVQYVTRKEQGHNVCTGRLSVGDLYSR